MNLMKYYLGGAGLLVSLGLGAIAQVGAAPPPASRGDGSTPHGGIITEYPLPTANSGPGGITVGSDGSLWFTENSVNKIGRITLGGVITEYPVPTANSYPLGITAGPDSNLWFTEDSGNKVGRITPGGAITEYTGLTPYSNPGGITAGPDGNLWFTEDSGNKEAIRFRGLEPPRVLGHS